MNRLALLIAGIATLGLAACDHPDAKRQRDARTPKTVAKLDCPERQGELKRVATATDGLSCAYEADGAEVTVKLVALNGGKPGDVLAATKTELAGLMPARAVEPAGEVKGDPDRVTINLPGVKIEAQDEKARIRVAGVEIDADDDRAEINIAKGLNASGEADGKEGIFAQYILADDKATDWKVVGYQARGPAAGPLAVATVKSKRGGRSDDLFDDVSDLLDYNVGGRGMKNIKISASASTN